MQLAATVAGIGDRRGRMGSNLTVAFHTEEPSQGLTCGPTTSREGPLLLCGVTTRPRLRIQRVPGPQVVGLCPGCS